MRIKKGIKNIVLLLGIIVVLVLVSVFCFNVFKILELIVIIIKIDDVKLLVGFNYNDSRK